RVLDPAAEKLRRVNEETLRLLAELSSPEPLARASAALYFAGLRDWRPADLSRTAGIDDPSAMHSALLSSGRLREVRLSPQRMLPIPSQAQKRTHVLRLRGAGSRGAVVRPPLSLEPGAVRR